MKKSNDQRIRELQKARDLDDEEFWKKTWWGNEALKLNRRANSISECKVIVIHASGKYPTVQFRVENDTPTIYGKQSFYLRNQWEWDREKPVEESYWYEDSGSSGWMAGAFDDEDFQQLLDEDGELYKNATEEQKALDTGENGDSTVGCIRPFSKEEKDIVGNCVLPTVRRLDEVFSGQGKSAEDYGYKIGKRVDLPDSELWETEIFGIDKTLKLKIFKAMHLLSIHAF